ncbi:hypothetical protein BM221_003498 [Beauveria bassiana]|uniref:Uncharacterized protein n=1 Tax=Beauveria bassiana TaxID=176275 RepID=A0A2N6NUT6_BEABA|nr:hypothetical protein BM221_003498 [Beauveria bassiana]
MATTTASVGTLESPIDLLGGLTGVMPHFYVDRTESAATPTTTVPAVDPLTALSDAIREAIASGDSSRKEADVHETDLEARNNQDIQDSIVWMGQPSLFSILSEIVVQVCAVDSGAGARLIDAILSVFPVDSMDITSVIPTVAEHSSVSAEDILPLILPAIAAAIGKQVQPTHIANIQNIDGIMANIILRGGLFVGQIINSVVFLARTELYEVLNQVAGLMCTAADHLTLPICTLSKQISGTTYRIVIPCDCTGSPSPSQPPQGYIPKETTSAANWSVLTIFPTAGYTFSSLLPTNLPPRYGENMPEPTKEMTAGNPPAQSNLPYGQPQTSYCSTGQSKEPTTTVDPMPSYSKQDEQSSQGPSSYNKENSIPEPESYSWNPRGWKYLGCFSDTAERVIRGGPRVFSGEDMSNEKSSTGDGLLDSMPRRHLSSLWWYLGDLNLYQRGP